MTNKEIQGFSPDYAPRVPGEYLRRFLDARGIKIVDFAKRTGRPTKTISEIISGKASITPETALQFERVLGESAGFWLKLEANHQLSKIREKEGSAAQSSDSKTWAKKFALLEMRKLGLLGENPKPADLVDSVLRAFGVSNIPAWNEYWQKRLDLARFKQQEHNPIDPYAVAIWLRCAEIVADGIETAEYSEQRFRQIIPKLRKLSLKPWGDISEGLIEECAKVGVAVALIPMVPKTGLRGAAYWATKDKAVIVISDRLKREPNVWFAFFHEVCHILEHSKKAVFIDGADSGTSERDIEAEADQFSAETLIPNHVLTEFTSTFGEYVPKMRADLFKRFADKYEVSPGLLLTRLQHHKVIPRQTSLAKLMRKVEFSIGA